jgi:hypothetical protein
VQNADSSECDRQNEEAKQRFRRLLEMIDKSEPGLVRTPIPLGVDEDGQPLVAIAWRKP